MSDAFYHPWKKLFPLKIMMHSSKQEEKTQKYKNIITWIRGKLPFSWPTVENTDSVDPTDQSYHNLLLIFHL